MNISRNLAAILRLLPHFSDEFVLPDLKWTPYPSFAQPGPSSTEKQQIRAATKDLRERLQQINTALTVLQDALQYVQTQKERYEKSMDLHVAALTPVHDLPFDVLSRIFVDVRNLDLDDFYSHLSIHHSSSHRTRCYPHAPPLATAHVNHRWSQVAMNTASLWSTIIFSNSLDYEAQIRMASQWLERSRLSPLTWIILAEACHFGYVAESNLDPASRPWIHQESLLKAVHLHASRVRSLQLYGKTASLLRGLRYEQTAFPALQSLTCGPIDLPSHHLDLPISTPFFNAGCVQYIKLPQGISPDYFAFDWYSVKSFSGSLNTQQLQKLWKSSLLRRCKIMLTLPAVGTEEINDLSTPHSLTSLWLSFFPSNYSSTLFRRLSHLPQLHTLIIDQRVDTSAAFWDFLRSSGGTLQVLSLAQREPVSFFHQSLRLTPNLKRFDCYEPNERLVEFCRMLLETPVVPDLHEWFIRNVAGFRETDLGPAVSTPAFRSNLRFVGIQHADENLYYPEEQRSESCSGDEDYAESVINHYLPFAKVEILPWSDDLSYKKFPYAGTEDL